MTTSNTLYHERSCYTKHLRPLVSPSCELSSPCTSQWGYRHSKHRQHSIRRHGRLRNCALPLTVLGVSQCDATKSSVDTISRLLTLLLSHARKRGPRMVGTQLAMAEVSGLWERAFRHGKERRCKIGSFTFIQKAAMEPTKRARPAFHDVPARYRARGLDFAHGMSGTPIPMRLPFASLARLGVKAPRRLIEKTDSVLKVSGACRLPVKPCRTGANA